MVQVAIAVLSITAIFFVTGPEENQRWGPVFGLASQPFWVYATYKAKQWGMFVLAFVYAGMWVRGILNGWFN